MSGSVVWMTSTWFVALLLFWQSVQTCRFTKVALIHWLTVILLKVSAHFRLIIRINIVEHLWPLSFFISCIEHDYSHVWLLTSSPPAVSWSAGQAFPLTQGSLIIYIEANEANGLPLHWTLSDDSSEKLFNYSAWRTKWCSEAYCNSIEHQMLSKLQWLNSTNANRIFSTLTKQQQFFFKSVAWDHISLTGITL